MKKFTTLMATSAAVLGLAGSLTAVNADNVTMSKLQSDNAQLSNTINQLKNNPKTQNVVPYEQFGGMIKGVNDVASNFKPGESRYQLTHDLGTQAYCGGDTAANAENDINSQYNDTKDAYTSASDLYSTADKNTDTVLEDLYALTGDDAATTSSSSKTNNDVKAPAQQATTSSSSKANNDVKAPAQQVTTSSNSKANNDVKTPAQQATTSSNSKANNDVKAPSQQATTSNSSKADNGVKATAQNTIANGAVANNNENTKAAGKTTTADTQQVNNNGTVSTTTQNGNVNAVSTPAEMHQAAQQATSNTTAVPTMPQTGEQGSEILAIAGGLVIAATAAGIVVYKKRN